MSSIVLDPIIAKHRHEDLLREAEQIRLAKRLAQANGTKSLLSRMVNLLSRSSRPAHSSGHSDGTLNQRHLADAKGS